MFKKKQNHKKILFIKIQKEKRLSQFEVKFLLRLQGWYSTFKCIIFIEVIVYAFQKEE